MSSQQRRALRHGANGRNVTVAYGAFADTLARFEAPAAALVMRSSMARARMVPSTSVHNIYISHGDWFEDKAAPENSHACNAPIGTR